ncbi:lytic transglycosylase domain-containing protein [Sulfitobacter aestuarii]|uniref:Lytic transglycosylase domain-containing protein n=1 Tax=Sulfitobacter aestuarii TaxID=2161676 RepID=A0ABW5U102_9RHOB
MRLLGLLLCAALALNAAPGAAFESLFAFPEPESATPPSPPAPRSEIRAGLSLPGIGTPEARLPGLAELALLADPDADLPARGRLPALTARALPVTQAAIGDTGLCIRAIRAAEQRHGLPKDILLAIGLQESGREMHGALTVWPWSVNIDGQSHFFDSRAEAQGFVAARQAEGKTSIDIGCMQINLRWHPQAFASAAQGFDPIANADYAARFLKRLRAEAQGWIDAAGRYHSATPRYKTLYIAGIERNLQVIENRAAHFAALADQDAGPGLATDAGTTLLTSAAPQPRRFNPLRAPVRHGAAGNRGYRRSFAPTAASRVLAQAVAAPSVPEADTAKGPWWSAEISEGGAARSIYSDRDLAPVIPAHAIAPLPGQAP